jgi:hypothetical protein
MRAWAVAAVASACLVPQALAGQMELVLDAGIGALAGGDFRGTPPGPSLAVALHIAERDSVQGGFEVGYARHRGSGVESATTQLDVLGLARWPVLSRPISAYLGGKLGYSHRSLTIADEPAKGGGFLIGPSGAMRFSVGTMHVQLTVDALYATYEELIMYGSREYGTDEDGFRLLFRAGLIFPLGSLRSRTELP